ncbi:MAG: deoxyribose-phosphate aldolase [Ruminococcaceae bacterium]|nr:deoxyribose-phosphate aldolase [Oscillospiraceae bacterium]
MDKQAILSRVDHTELNPAATWEDIRTLCDDAITYGTATVCIPPCYVKRAVGYVDGKLPICTVIGFPHGNSPTAAKAYEAKCVAEAGAKEVDMVINRGWVKDGLFEAVTNEIAIVARACAPATLKVIIECCGLTDTEKVALCHCVTQAGAAYIKTSTGFDKGGATVQDVQLMARNVGPGVKVKAAGGIRSFEAAQAMIEAGADRIGASALVKLMKSEG